MNRDLLYALLGAGLLMWAGVCSADDSDAELKAATDSIAVLEPIVQRLTVEADSLRPLALRADTVRIEVERVVRVEVDRSRERFRAAADSLRASLDSVQSVHLTNLEASHREEVRAVQRIADERLAWGTAWRTYAIATDSLAKAQSAQIALHSMVNAGLRSALRQERQQVWLSRGLATVGVVAVLVLK